MGGSSVDVTEKTGRSMKQTVHPKQSPYKLLTCNRFDYLDYLAAGTGPRILISRVLIPIARPHSSPVLIYFQSLSPHVRSG